MKVHLAGLARNAAACIKPKNDTGAYAYMLGELAEHVGLVQQGAATLLQFGEQYCLVEERPPTETADRLEARRMLKVAFADVVPSDSDAFAIAALDGLQIAAVEAVAALVRRYDNSGEMD